jgi:hypothetical protein
MALFGKLAVQLDRNAALTLEVDNWKVCSSSLETVTQYFDK